MPIQLPPSPPAARRVSVVFLVALASTAALVAQPSFEPAMAIHSNAGTDTGADNRPSVAADGTTWIVAWRSREDVSGGAGTDDDILTVRSTDGGATWSEPGFLNSYAEDDNATGHQADESVQLFAGGGTILAIWVTNKYLVNDSVTDLAFARSTDGGQSWSAAQLLSADFAGDTGEHVAPALATDGSGNWVVVWESDDPRADLALGTDADILFSRSNDDGVTWSAPSAVNDDADEDLARDYDPTLATDGDGTWIVAWSRESSGSRGASEGDLLLARSLNVGDSGETPAWSAAAVMDPDPAPAPSDKSDVHIATDGANRWVTVFQDGSSEIRAHSSTDDGVTWSLSVVLAEGSVDEPMTVALGDGSWLGLWGAEQASSRGEGVDRDLFWSRSPDGGATWGPSSAVNDYATTDSGEDDSVHAVVDSLGRTAVVWSSDEDLEGVLGLDSDVLFSSLPSFTAIFWDGFETGDLDAWSP